MKRFLIIFPLLATIVLAGCNTNNYQQQNEIQSNSDQWNSRTTIVTENVDYNFQQWLQFTSTTGKFTIEFPTYPTSEITPSTYTQSIMYHTEDTAGTFYTVHAVIYQTVIGATEIEAGLEHALNWIINSSQGDELISSNFDYMPATRVGEWVDDLPKVLDYVIKNTNEDRHIQWRMIIVDNVFYDLKIVSYTNYWNQSNYDKFIDSFRPTY